MNVYPFIEAEKAQQHGPGARGNVARACVLLKVSRAAYYAHRARLVAGPSARQVEDDRLSELIAAVHADSRGTYGAPRVHTELAETGRRHSRKRIARLMRAAGLRGKTPKRWRKTTVPDPAAAPAADLIGRDFTTDPDQVNTRWCGDITYINTWDGWLYLATVIDIATRKVVGWATADHLRTDLPAAALTNAITSRRPDPGRSSTPTAAASTPVSSTPPSPRPTRSGCRSAARGECWDNAVAESFFATIKTELLDRQPWPTRAAAHHAIFDYIEGWYNTRRHSTLGYLSPTAYEATAQHQGATAA